MNLSAGYARPAGAGSAGGVVLSLEPKYGLNDQVDLGMRFEGAFMGRALAYNGKTTQTQINLAGSYILTGNYLLTTSNFRPFIGLGAGLYTTVGGSLTTDSSTGATQVNDASVKGGQKFGGMARIGLKTGHFTLGAEYNFIPATQISLTSVQVIKSNNSYWGIKFGFDIGGGAYR
ncbi:MAG: hypothetical protein LH609_02720 [Rudanella sp.]|nr:hypothetical protein [Rudanella sp.]